jgi:MFS family permease
MAKLSKVTQSTVLMGGDVEQSDTSEFASSKTSRPRLHPTVVALAVVSMLHDLAGDMVTPLLPALIATMGNGPAALGLIEGTADATSSLLKLVSGYVADRIGRLKALTVLGYGVANVLRPLLAFSNSWWQVLAIRFGDRVGKGVRGSPRDALVASVTTKETRGYAFGFHHALESLGAVFGTVLGYALLSSGMTLRRVIFWSAAPGIVTMLVVGLGVRSRAAVPASSAVRIGIPPVPDFRRLLLAVVTFTLGNSSDAFLLWRAREVGVPLTLTPILWALLHLVRSATATWGGRLSDRRGRSFTITAGWIVYALTYAGFAACHATWQVWLLFTIYGAYYGLTEGAQKALVVDMVAKEWQGRALGAFQMAVGVAALPASAVFGVLYREWGARAAFGAGGALALVATILLPRSPPP